MDKTFILRQYLKDHRKILWVSGIFVFCYFFLYFLYDVRLEPVFYTLFLMILAVLPFIVQDIRRYGRTAAKISENIHSSFVDQFQLPEADGLIEQCYQREIQSIIQDSMAESGG